ncbi:hypothetical protein T492DRAFT_864421 [Pavlovales sp. CCMP2436]|nr:hypothetical protein T492DRAFT_864421 [Pavlovales sp. CCMP2436]
MTVVGSAAGTEVETAEAMVPGLAVETVAGLVVDSAVGSVESSSVKSSSTPALLAAVAHASGAKQPWSQWLSRVPLASDPLVVEVGANDHGADNDDPALQAPLPSTFAKLEARYRGNPRVRTLNALACSFNNPPVPNATCLAAGSHMTFYSIDLSNAKGTHGSATADTRCLQGVHASIFESSMQ